MINLSVDTRNLSSSMSKEHLEIVLSEMIFLVENDFNINVEESYSAFSYWIPTPDEEIEELELFGIIELASEASEFDKIIHLTHEVGHVIYRIDQIGRASCRER